MTEPAHNRFKAPFFVLMVLLGIGLLVFGLIVGAWVVAIIGAVEIVASTLALRVVRSGRNPWWIRSPLDRRQEG